MFTRTRRPLPPKTIAESVVALCLLLALPSTMLAAGKQSITCHGQGGGTKHIYIEHSPANSNVCRTLYSPNGTQFKAIAWAQNSSQKCYDVANNLAARFQRGGWDCSLTDNVLAMNKPIADYKPVVSKIATAHTMPQKKKTEPKPDDPEIIEQPSPAEEVETVSEEEILKTIER